MKTYLEEYLFLEKAAAETSDHCVYKQIMEKMQKLHYHYLTPAERQYLKSRKAPQFLELEITEECEYEEDISQTD